MHAAAGAARSFPAPAGLSMAMHVPGDARVYGWTSVGRGGNPSPVGMVYIPVIAHLALSLIG